MSEEVLIGENTETVKYGAKHKKTGELILVESSEDILRYRLSQMSDNLLMECDIIILTDVDEEVLFG